MSPPDKFWEKSNFKTSVGSEARSAMADYGVETPKPVSWCYKFRLCVKEAIILEVQKLSSLIDLVFTTGNLN